MRRAARSLRDVAALARGGGGDEMRALVRLAARGCDWRVAHASSSRACSSRDEARENTASLLDAEGAGFTGAFTRARAIPNAASSNRGYKINPRNLLEFYRSKLIMLLAFVTLALPRTELVAVCARATAAAC